MITKNQLMDALLNDQLANLNSPNTLLVNENGKSAVRIIAAHHHEYYMDENLRIMGMSVVVDPSLSDGEFVLKYIYRE
jgi:hypothetical protein